MTCCSPSVVGELGFDPTKATMAAPRPNGGMLAPDGKPRAVPDIKVDLFVRTYHSKLEELSLLLRSAAFFWPPQWGVVVALDGGSDLDKAMCKLLPDWVRCILVERPAFYGQLNMTFRMLSGRMAPGMVWKEWSELWADRYSQAEYIAIIDSDVVFTTFATPQLLFEIGDDKRPRPVIWGHTHDIYFPHTILQLVGPIVADFMDSFPLTVHRSHFQDLRRLVIKRHGSQRASAKQSEPQTASAKARAFDRAFFAYVKAVHRTSADWNPTSDCFKCGECPSFHAMMGSFLWANHRDKYVWSIRHGHLSGISLEHTCPRLRVSHHLAYWGSESVPEYPLISMKISSKFPFFSLGYITRATALIFAGLCEVPWRKRRENPANESSDGNHVGRISYGLGIDSDLLEGYRHYGLEDAQRDMCKHGTQLLDSTMESFQRLLTWRYPASPVHEAEVAYCGGLRPAALQAEYRHMMASLAFAV